MYLGDKSRPILACILSLQVVIPGYLGSWCLSNILVQSALWTHVSLVSNLHTFPGPRKNWREFGGLVLQSTILEWPNIQLFTVNDKQSAEPLTPECFKVLNN